MTEAVQLIERAWQVDEDGFFVIDLFDHDSTMPVLFTEIPCPSGVFRRPRLSGGQWVEGHVEDQQQLFVAEKNAAIKRIEKGFASAMKAGVPFNFNGVDDVIQTRDERDLINISGVTTRAMLLQSQNNSDPVINFRADSNTIYQLTPVQAIQLGEVVAIKMEEIYGIFWMLKDAVAQATTVDEVEAIQWPQAE